MPCRNRRGGSFGLQPAPIEATRTAAADTGDGIAPLPFLSAVFGALVVGLGAGGALHLLHARGGRTNPRTGLSP